VKLTVELQGLSGLREIKGFHDESLKDVCEIYVVDINPHHYYYFLVIRLILPRDFNF